VRDHLFDALSSGQGVVRFVHVGAHDGVSIDDNQPADPFRTRALRHGWSGLLIEPAPEAFARLKANYAGCAVDLANVAIWSSEGEKTFHIVEAADWLSSFFPQTVLRDDAQHGDLRSSVRPIEVRTSRLEDLCRETGHTQPNVLLVDAEGSDDIAVRSFDFSAHKPDVVQFKHLHLSTQASSDLGDWLTGLGYELVYDRYDVLALNPARFDAALVRFCQDLLVTARAN
jgi:FkbM family methyltransferase